MTETYGCPECGDEFDSEEAREQHRRAKHEEGSRPSSSPDRSWTGYGLVATGVLLLAAVAGYWWIPTGSSVEYPTQSDHWHAEYTIVLCGEEVPARPYSQGGVHTHGKGQIHVHPHSSATAGENANLGEFFESFDGTLTSERIAVPMYGTYENGDTCDGSPGEVAVSVNGERIENPAEYVVQDGDSVRFTFRAE